MNKKLLISLGVIAVLVFILLLVNRTQSPDVPAMKPWKGSADEININKGDSRIRIFRDNERWLINDAAYPADRDAVHAMENQLKNLVITDLISDRPQYERYELSPDKAIEVSVKRGAELLRHLYIGKKSSTNRHTYVRIADRPEVYLASSALADDFNKSLDDIRDKEIMKIGKSEIQSVEINYKGRRLTLSKAIEEKKPAAAEKDKTGSDKKAASVEKTEKWICNEFKNIALDENQVGQILTSFDPLKAAAYPAMEKKDLKAPTCSIKIKTNSKTIDLVVYQKLEENRYLGTSSESKYLFSLDGWKAEKYMKSIDDLNQKQGAP